MEQAGSGPRTQLNTQESYGVGYSGDAAGAGQPDAQTVMTPARVEERHAKVASEERGELGGPGPDVSMEGPVRDGMGDREGGSMQER